MARKQKEFPGMEQPVIEEVEKVAEDYQDARDRRMTLTKQETAAQADLLAMMEKHKLTEYVFDGKRVRIVEGEKKVEVKTIKVEDPDE